MKTILTKAARLPGRSARAATLQTGQPTPALGFKNILVATDFSALSLLALQRAKDFADQFDASIHLLHVIDKPPLLSDLENIPIAIPDRNLESTAKRRLIKLAATEIPPLVPSFPEVRWGNPAEEIVNHARRRKVDLILLGTHGRTGFKHLMLGSTAETVVRRAPCPVLVVRERERSEI